MTFDVITASSARVKWSIITMSHRKVLERVVDINGPTTLTWDLKDQKGGFVADGLYYLRLEVGDMAGKTGKIWKVLVAR